MKKFVEKILKVAVIAVVLALAFTSVDAQYDVRSRVPALTQFYSTADSAASELTTYQVHQLRRSQQISRRTAVRVHFSSPLGGSRGSGSYVKYENHYLVITAAHIFSSVGTDLTGTLTQIEVAEGQHFDASIVYIDRTTDIAVVRLPNRLPDITPARLSIPSEPNVNVGDAIVYTGYPSHHNRLTIYGRLAGYASNGDFVMHSYAWPGSSGSGVFDSRGRLIGILYGIDVGMGPAGIPDLVEDIVYISPIWKLDRQQLRLQLEVFSQ